MSAVPSYRLVMFFALQPSASETLSVGTSLATAAWVAASWISARRPRLPLQQVTGAAVGAAGLFFLGLAAL